MSGAGGFLYVPDVAVWQPPAGRVIRISAQLRTKRAVLGAFRKQLEFPDYFGWNWDALNDVLQGRERAGRAILIHDGIPFTSASTRSRRIYLEILAGLTNGNRADCDPWTIVFPENCREEIGRLLLNDS
jgi:RNAse (barnase) inhibitor barstar